MLSSCILMFVMCWKRYSWASGPMAKTRGTYWLYLFHFFLNSKLIFQNDFVVKHVIFVDLFRNFGDFVLGGLCGSWREHVSHLLFWSLALWRGYFRKLRVSHYKTLFFLLFTEHLLFFWQRVLAGRVACSWWDGAGPKAKYRLRKQKNPNYPHCEFDVNLFKNQQKRIDTWQVSQQNIMLQCKY